MDSRLPFQDQTVIVTGAAGGLGKAIAVAYLNGGANVSICDVDAERLDTCEQEWSKSYPGKFLIDRMDITENDSLERFFGDTIFRFGGVNILISNAGILDDFSPAGDCKQGVWDRTIAVNLTAAFVASKLAVRQFEKQHPTGGLIINIGSESSIRPTKSGLAYTVSKHGLDGLTKHTASYYAHMGVSSICLVLGAIVGTNIYKSLAGGIHASFAETMKQLTKDIDPAKHSVSVESVAQFCLFLSDPAMATGANGTCIEFRKNWTFQ